jgi:site-specific DNA recombinase
MGHVSGQAERIIPALVCEQVDAVLHRANRPRYEKHRFAFAGLLTCAHDGCIVTAETKKQKYTYYHCAGYRGRCDLPYRREESLGQSLISILDGIYIPQKAIQQIVESRRMPPTMLPKNGKERLFTWAEVSRRSAGRNSRPMKTN